jgi:hypothetical protein
VIVLLVPGALFRPMRESDGAVQTIGAAVDALAIAGRRKKMKRNLMQG